MSGAGGDGRLRPVTGNAQFAVEPDSFAAEGTVEPLSQPATRDYDPEPGRERIRGRLAATLVGAVLIGSFGLGGSVAAG